MNNTRIIQLINEFPLLALLIDLQPLSWFNPKVTSYVEALPYVGLTALDVQDASDRLLRFAPFLCLAFPETQESNGIIESPLQAIPLMQAALGKHYQVDLLGRMMIKLDAQLPISGSIKARGGIYEVLQHAEKLAIAAGILHVDDDYSKINSPQF